MPPHPTVPDVVNEHIRNEISVLAGRGFAWDGRDALPMRPDVHEFFFQHLCRSVNPWIKPTATPRVVLHRDGTVELTWVYADRTLRLHVPCQHVVICEKSDTECGGNTVVRVRLDYTSLEDADEIRGAFFWLRGEE